VTHLPPPVIVSNRWNAAEILIDARYEASLEHAYSSDNSHIMK